MKIKEKMKKYLKNFLFKRGYKISKINNHPLQHSNPFLACKSLMFIENPTIFDIGMNHGQTLKKILEVFPNSIVHGFEASKYCFKSLDQSFKKNKNFFLNNLAIGDETKVMKFNEYSWDALNSFLTRSYGRAQIIETYDVNVTTIDDYCCNNNIQKIDILKSDTEGFELKVLTGAQKMFNENNVHFVFIEMFFDLNFFDQASVGEIFSFLEKKNFSLVKFYEFGLTGDGIASKSDALFINLNYK